MRLSTAVVAGAATATTIPAHLLFGPVLPAAAVPPPPVADTRAHAPYCGDPASTDFPIEAKIHGGPDTYAPGGGWQTWNLDLRNTTSADCRRIHPVVVLVDRERGLTKERIGLEFYEETGRKWRPVAFETTDQDEQIGVFDGDGFKGFAVRAHKHLTVKVRMRFSAGTGENRVTAKIATVQRRDDDGDWLGASNDYEFDIRGGAGDGDQPRHQPGAGKEGKERPKPDPGQSSRGRAPGESPQRPLPAPESDALASTGEKVLLWFAGVAGACFLGGAALVIAARRRAR
ncbi:hypothetical protein [Streptomyces sp. KR80]|uniref:hypothetical protein n=1 Tax=Streptomyces sp. KR80 TaxID=3457426 RepID=UPI003FD6B90C